MTTVRFVFALALLLGTASGSAQDRPQRRPHVVQIAPTVIEGHRQLPLAIVLTRSHVDFSTPELRTSFVREIVRSNRFQAR